MHIGFTCSTDTDLVVEEIARKEQLITSSKIDQVRKLVQRILDLCRFFFFVNAKDCSEGWHDFCPVLLSLLHIWMIFVEFSAVSIIF